MTQHIVIDLFDGVEELDVIGPWEALAHWCQEFPQDGWSVRLVSDDGKPRRAAKGLLLTPTAAKGDVPAPSLIIQPGGVGTHVRKDDLAHVDWLRQASADGALITSVCTGARVLAAAGLLRGRPFTTYHEAFDDVLSFEPSAHARPGERWVDDGDVITAAGVSAGIDMSLHLIGRLAGVTRAQQVQNGIEYHPAPPTWGAAYGDER